MEHCQEIIKYYIMSELLINTAGTILGGLLLTLILFALNEYCFPRKNLSGEWIAVVKILKTPHKPYENLSIEYKVHLLQKGPEISGSGEKIKDIYADGNEYKFEREKRVIIEVDGYYERKYLKKSVVYLNIEEQGRKRETRATYILILQDPKRMSGTFISTAADSSGLIEMKYS